MRYNLEGFDSEYDKKEKKGFISKFLLVLVIVLITSGGIYFATVSLPSTIPSTMQPKKEKIIFDLEDTLADENIAKQAELVRAPGNKIYYFDTEGSVVIYRKDRNADSDPFQMYVIEVEKIINKDGSEYNISDCYDDTAEINENLTCINRADTYIISEPDLAIIEESVFNERYK